jgi:hypothetical protein
MDGGAYSTDNADLAPGYDGVLILALRAGRPPLAVVSLEAAVARLRRCGGTTVEVMHPDDATDAVLASVGGDLLDPSVRERAATAGREQGRRLAAGGLAWSLA